MFACFCACRGAGLDSPGEWFVVVGWLPGGCFFGSERTSGGRSRAGSSGRGSACVGSAQGPEAPTVSDSERRHAAGRPPGGQRAQPKALSYRSHDRSDTAEIDAASGRAHAIAVRWSRLRCTCSTGGARLNARCILRCTRTRHSACGWPVHRRAVQSAAATVPAEARA